MTDIDLSTLSDADLIALAKQQGLPVKEPAPTDLSKLSDDELIAMAKAQGLPVKEKAPAEPPPMMYVDPLGIPTAETAPITQDARDSAKAFGSGTLHGATIGADDVVRAWLDVLRLPREFFREAVDDRADLQSGQLLDAEPGHERGAEQGVIAFADLFVAADASNEELEFLRSQYSCLGHKSSNVRYSDIGNTAKKKGLPEFTFGGEILCWDRSGIWLTGRNTSTV